jgi:POT family proton-dependent oligopeptide transporter
MGAISQHESVSPTAATPSKHPRALYTLFFTEMWERFSYYGMRALLVLFMVDAIQHGGMGLTDPIATAIYGLYTASVYLAALPGGWLADRIFGAQKSVWYGGITIACGHFVLALPRMETFYFGLILVVIGTGLLKPNVSALVGELYPEGGARRDAGFTIFYMGINLGAALGPLICGALGEKINWHYGFAAAGVGMLAGLIQFKMTAHHLGDAGLKPGQSQGLNQSQRFSLAIVLVAIFALVAMVFAGVIRINPIALARSTTIVIVAMAVFYFAWLLLWAGLEKAERQRVAVIVILFLAAALFWAGFEQTGSSFNFFAQRYTERKLSLIQFEIPASWFLSLGAVFIISLAPLVAAMWLFLGRRHLNPSLPVKFGVGLLLLAVGFVVMAGAAKLVATGHKAGPSWLVATYFIHTLGELCLSPVGLSSVTKLAPRRFVGQLMGTWFLAASLGSLIAGLIAGEFRTDAVDQMSWQYLRIGILPVLAGAALILARNPIKRWMAGIE